MELTQAAELSGLSLTKLKSYNTGYKLNVTAPNGPHYLMLPKSHASQFRDSLAVVDIAAVQSTQLADNKAAGGAKYKVRPGDTLSSIAKHLNVKTADLQKWNNLHSSSSLKIGQTLQVASNTSFAVAGNSSITYQVRKGDSLASIAKRHGVNIKDVMRWNNALDSAGTLQPGLRLTLFVNGKATDS